MQAQEAEIEMKPIVPARFNLKVNVAIPSLVGNKSLRQSFRGVYDGTANLQLRLVKGVYLGMHGGYTGFKVSADKIPLINTECRTTSAGLNLGYEKFTHPRVSVFFNLAASYNWINYYKVSCPDSIQPQKNYLAWSYKPSVGFSYYSDDNFSLGLSASYTFLLNRFNPESICLDNYKTFNPNDSKATTSFFSIGVVLNFSLRKGLFEGSNEPEGDDEN